MWTAMNLTNSHSEYEFGEIDLVTKPLPPPVDVISKEIGDVIRCVNFVVLSTLIAWFGICTNIINMIVFHRQGFNTTTNISFFALAISDLLCLVTGQLSAHLFNPYIVNVHFVPVEIGYLSGGWLHICCGRITGWITVFITAERCMGITLPLKVKLIITLRRTTITMCFIFVIHFSMLLPDYVTLYWDWKFVPAKNKTLFGFVYRSYNDYTYNLSYILTSCSGMMSFAWVIILTSFLVTKLTHKSKWRSQATGGSDKSEAVSTRDMRTMKMIIMIASVLIVCYVPGTIVSLVPSFITEFMLGCAFSNSYFSCWSIAWVFDTINSSVNVLLYYRMSTKYRQTFTVLFSNRVNLDTRTQVVDAGTRLDLSIRSGNPVLGTK